MNEVMALFKALADDSRARILLALRRQPLYVCQIVELVALATSTVSEHLLILKEVGLVHGHREGRWVCYRLAEPPARTAPGMLLACLFRVLEEDQQVRQDARRLKHILQVDPGELCSRQRTAEGKCCGRAAGKLRSPRGLAVSSVN